MAVVFRIYWFFDSIVLEVPPLPDGSDGPPVLCVRFKAYLQMTPGAGGADASPVGPPCVGQHDVRLLKSSWAMILPALQGQGDPQAAIAACFANEGDPNAAPDATPTVQQMRRTLQLRVISEVPIRNPIAYLGALSAAVNAP